jgi:hypothetical protein
MDNMEKHDKTRSLSGSSLPPEDSTQPKKPQPVPAEMPRSGDAVLIIFADHPNALQFDLLDQVTLGRRSEAGDQPDVDLAPYGGFPAGVSRLHVKLHRVDNQIMMEDLGSRNGSYIGDDRLDPGKKVLVTNGQAIRFGGLNGWIYFEGIK